MEYLRYDIVQPAKEPALHINWVARGKNKRRKALFIYGSWYNIRHTPGYQLRLFQVCEGATAYWTGKCNVCIFSYVSFLSEKFTYPTNLYGLSRMSSTRSVNRKHSRSRSKDASSPPAQSRHRSDRPKS